MFKQKTVIGNYKKTKNTQKQIHKTDKQFIASHQCGI